jgi:hypothetical protein
LIEPSGLNASSFAYRLTPAGASGPMRTMGVLPIVERMSGVDGAARGAAGSRRRIAFAGVLEEGIHRHAITLFAVEVVRGGVRHARDCEASHAPAALRRPRLRRWIVRTRSKDPVPVADLTASSRCGIAAGSCERSRARTSATTALPSAPATWARQSAFPSDVPSDPRASRRCLQLPLEARGRIRRHALVDLESPREQLVRELLARRRAQRLRCFRHPRVRAGAPQQAAKSEPATIETAFICISPWKVAITATPRRGSAQGGDDAVHLGRRDHGLERRHEARVLHAETMYCQR